MRKIPDLSHINKGLIFHLSEKGPKGALKGAVRKNITNITIITPTPKTYP